MDYKKSYWICIICACLGFALGLISYLTVEERGLSTFFGVFGLIVVTLGSIQRLIFYRCPYCYKTLIRKGIPKYCPECGRKLDS